MIIGQTLHSQDSTNGDVYFSHWFPRGGNMAVFSCEVIAHANTTNDIDSLTVQVQTKNAEDSDKDAIDLLGTPESITLSAGTVTSFEAGAGLDSASQGIQELVRYKLTVKAKSSGRAWVHQRMLDPGWVSN